MKNEVKLPETTPKSRTGVLCVCIPLNVELEVKIKDLIEDLFSKQGPLADQLVKSVSIVLYQENRWDICVHH